MIPHQGSLEALARFCMKHSYQGKIGTFTIDHIMKMARLILDMNCFVLSDKYYKQTRGGALGSAFTQVLANIYTLEQEEDLVQHQTVNGINSILERMQTKDVNIKITSKINTCVDFLYVTISNQNGHLRTSIFHKPTAEPYILPYTSDHPVHIRRNIPYASLSRAASICSHMEDFKMECIRIDMSLLFNSYPPNFILKQFNRFLQVKDVVEPSYQLDQQLYHQLTRREKQFTKMIQDPIRSPVVLQPKIWNSSLLYPRYIFDSSLSIRFPSKFRTWWKTHYRFQESPVENVTVKVVANTNQTSEQYLIYKNLKRLC